MEPYRLKTLRGLGRTRSARKAEEKWSEDYLHILQKFYPNGRTEGDDFRVSGEGERGRRIRFNLSDGRWEDFADIEEQGVGILSFVAYLDGWNGVARLLREFSDSKDNSLDIPLYVEGKVPDFNQVVKFAEKKGLVLAKRWEYKDVDGFRLGVRLRFEDKKTGAKEFRLLSYRSKKVLDDGRVRPEGWRLDGGWGEISPIYGAEKFADQTDHRPVLICKFLGPVS